MQPTQHQPPRATPHKGFRTTLFLIILISAALTTACPTNDPNPGVTHDPDPSMGTDDRPIIITGGSLDLYFNHTAYKPDPSARSSADARYRLDGYRITAMRVYNDDGADNSTPICEPTFTGGASISVGYRVGPDAPKITVSGAPASGTNRPYVELGFDGSANSLPLRPNSKNMRFNKRAKLESVSYAVGTGGTTNCGPLPANGKVTIEIDVSYVK
ncbi:MAG TPA: hypothetical protein VNA19_16360 [Pyrinomonadaceae bacterium]|nr:hypothetical protein [Pyrinomonadaceae bacterium]